MSGRNQDREHYEFGAFRVDVAERVLTKGQQVIPLTPKAFDTLLVLVRKERPRRGKGRAAQSMYGRTRLLKKAFWQSMLRRFGKR